MLILNKLNKNKKLRKEKNMSTPERPGTNHEQATFANQEMVQFNDGAMALGFRMPGDKLPLGPDSGHKYASNFYTNDMAIIETDHGETYGLAGGWVIDGHTQQAVAAISDTIEVTVGEPCALLSRKYAVKSVLLRYKDFVPASEQAEHQMDEPSPFIALEAQALAINSANKSSL